MKKSIQSPLYLLQYAVDTFLFEAAKDIAIGVEYLQKGTKELSDFFAIHRLNVNADKTEFIVFCKSSKNSSIKNATLKVGDCLIKQKESVKYLGVHLDRNLNYQAEVKNILRKMACSIKTISYVYDFLPEKTRLILLNALVISHLQYWLVLFNGISQSLISTFEKQLHWGRKACFNRYKMDSAQDWRTKHGIISVRKTLDMNAIKLFWKWKHNLLPAFSQPNLETARITSHDRTKNLYYRAHSRSEQMRNSLFKRVVPLWNVLPDKKKSGNQTYDTLKKRLKKYFTEKFIS